MKDRKLLILSLCFMLLACMTTSCTEEEVKPTNADSIWKEGNLTGVDDWQNQV